MSNSSRIIIATGATGVIAALTGAAYWYATRDGFTGRASPIRALRARMPQNVNDEFLKNWVTWDPNEVRFEIPPTTLQPRQWRSYNGVFHGWVRSAIPSGAKHVPVIPIQRTPLVPEGFIPRSTGYKYLNAIRRVMRSIGWDGDARPVFLLLARETGWDHCAWNYNHGNVKAQGTVFVRDLETLLRQKMIFTTNQECVGIHVLIDNSPSCDGYPSYDSHEAFFRRLKRVFDGYGASELLNSGTYEDAIRFARKLGEKRYSPATADARERDMRAEWPLWAQRLGAHWTK